MSSIRTAFDRTNPTATAFKRSALGTARGGSSLTTHPHFYPCCDITPPVDTVCDLYWDRVRFCVREPVRVILSGFSGTVRQQGVRDFNLSALNGAWPLYYSLRLPVNDEFGFPVDGWEFYNSQCIYIYLYASKIYDDPPINIHVTAVDWFLDVEVLNGDQCSQPFDPAAGESFFIRFIQRIGLCEGRSICALPTFGVLDGQGRMAEVITGECTPPCPAEHISVMEARRFPKQMPASLSVAMTGYNGFDWHNKKLCTGDPMTFDHWETGRQPCDPDHRFVNNPQDYTDVVRNSYDPMLVGLNVPVPLIDSLDWSNCTSGDTLRGNGVLNIIAHWREFSGNGHPPVEIYFFAYCENDTWKFKLRVEFTPVHSVFFVQCCGCPSSGSFCGEIEGLIPVDKQVGQYCVKTMLEFPILSLDDLRKIEFNYVLATAGPLPGEDPCGQFIDGCGGVCSTYFTQRWRLFGF